MQMNILSCTRGVQLKIRNYRSTVGLRHLTTTIAYLKVLNVQIEILYLLYIIWSINVFVTTLGHNSLLSFGYFLLQHP